MKVARCLFCLGNKLRGGAWQAVGFCCLRCRRFAPVHIPIRRFLMIFGKPALSRYPVRDVGTWGIRHFRTHDSEYA